MRNRKLPVRRGLEPRRRAARPGPTEPRPGAGEGTALLAGRSRAIRRVVDQLLHVASTHAPVLIEGEPGTGKGAAAHMLHRDGPRSDRPFVRFDCGVLAPGLIEGELFGIESGSGGEP